MDVKHSTPCILFQTGTPVAHGDQVWLEELIGSVSNQSSSSRPSSPSVPSSSPGDSRSSSDGTGSLHSWNSGETCLLHSCIKKQSREAFQIRLREDSGWGRLTVYPSSGPHGGAHPLAEQGGGSHRDLHQGRAVARSHTSTERVKLPRLLEERIKAKLKFSQFLDEVTSNVLDPNSLEAFGKPVSLSGFTIKNQIQVVNPLPCSMAQQQDALPAPQTPEEETYHEIPQKTYLETDIDCIWMDFEPQDLEVKAETQAQLEIDEKGLIPPPPQFCQGFKMKSPFPECCRDFPRYPYRSASVPRGINMVSDESRPRL